MERELNLCQHLYACVLIRWIIKGTRKLGLPFWSPFLVFPISLFLVTSWVWVWLCLGEVWNRESCIEQSEGGEAEFNNFRNGAEFPWNISLSSCCTGGEEDFYYTLNKLIESSCLPVDKDTYSFPIRNFYKLKSCCLWDKCFPIYIVPTLPGVQTITGPLSSSLKAVLCLGYPLACA